MISKYRTKGLSLKKALFFCGLSKSSYYYKQRSGNPGRKPSTHTLTRNGDEVSNAAVVSYIEQVYDDPFIDYGYVKMTYELRDTYHLLINHKKVYRLMKESSLLQERRGREKRNRRRVSSWKVSVSRPFELLEMDIKHIRVSGEGKQYYMLNVLDCYSWKLVGYRFSASIKKHDVVNLLRSIFALYDYPSRITIRSDNGSQFVAKRVAEYLDEANVAHEFTHVATPQENGYVESFHSIVSRFIRQRGPFRDFEEAKDVLQRWTQYYNERRRHKGCRYSTPNEVMRRYFEKQKLGNNIA